MRYLILFSLLFLLSCNNTKEGLTTVEGVVKDETDGSVMPNFKVTIYKEVSAFGALDNGLTHEMETYTTNANGQFSASFEADKRHIYYVGLPPQGDEKYCYASTSIKSAEKNNIEVKAKRSGTIKLHLINEAPIDTAEEFWVDMIGGSRVNFFMKDTIVFMQRCSNTEAKVHWRIRSNGNLSEGEKNVTPGPWDTALIEIKY